MASPTESPSFRTRWNSQSRIPLEEVGLNLEEKLIQDHISDGWVCDQKSDNIIIFSTHLQDGRKWTREYDRRTCAFICQRFHLTEMATKALDWPSGTFGE